MTANDWILPWFMLVRIMYIMLNLVGLFLSSCNTSWGIIVILTLVYTLHSRKLRG
ncbi:Uncharacterised protein [Escherichia coli]|uniref:Uncharacterized protein n=1 Tax=Escherichia coli TaxID=562 RepID=A0A2X1QEW2_ECOLX|nr:Uncharacterised protein [Escherichia coli]STM15734.1 Uncharacterised protein [Escherichia coli]